MEHTQPNRPLPRRRRSRLPALLALMLALIGVCLLAAAALWVTRELPRLAVQRFGPLDPGLSFNERILYSARLLLQREELLLPAGEAGDEQPFSVEMGEPVPSIAERLERQGLVRSAGAFQNYLIYSGLDTGLQAGEYRLSPSMNALQVAQALQDATPKEVEFFLMPGWRAEEIGAALAASGLQVTPEAFMAAVVAPDRFYLPPAAGAPATLEGLLMPGSYTFPREISVDDVTAIFLAGFSEAIDDQIVAGIENQGLSFYEGVILASIVQREAVIASEQPMIASVFLNRLAAGMKLESDPTVQYAAGYNPDQATWWTNPLSVDDLALDSPYNTYRYAGLPPGPIANPSLTALRAVAFPAQTPYYYFRARCDDSGEHTFSKTYAEHLQNACP